MTPVTDPVIAFESPAAWEAWLAEQHATSSGVWVKIAKKASGIPTVTHAEAVEGALCYGWIDGQRNTFDDRWFLQRFTPRRSRSRWSKINCGKVEKLIEEGRMQPAGLREIERARADGRWDAAYGAPGTATVPTDLQRAATCSLRGVSPSMRVLTCMFGASEASERPKVICSRHCILKGDGQRSRIWMTASAANTRP